MVDREEKIKEAIKEIEENSMSTKKASKKFGIARSTLQFRMGPRFKKPGYGPAAYLTKDEENVLVNWIITCQRRGFPKRMEDVQTSVQNFVKENNRKTPFPNGLPGKGWYYAFCKRHPELCLRTAEPVTQASSCVSESDVRKWFNLIQKELDDLGHRDVLLDEARIYNGDETNFLLCPKNKKVIAARGTKNVYEVDQATAKASLTVMFTFGASGALTPPMVIYPYKRKPPKDILETVPDKWGVGYSDNGWMKASIFYEYIANVFNPYLLENNIAKPGILFVDGHKTHLTLQVNKLCNDLGIILVALYPNATRILQPADVAAFKPLKTGWQRGILEWRREHPNLQFSKENFAPLLQKVIEKYINENTIKKGFRATGLFPWNSNSIDYSKCLGKSTGDQLSVKDTEIVNADLENTRVLDFESFKSIIGHETLQSLQMQNLDNDKSEMKYLHKILKIFTKDDNEGFDINNMPVDILVDDVITEEHNSDITYAAVEKSENMDITVNELDIALHEFDISMEHMANNETVASMPSTSVTVDTDKSSPITQILVWPKTPERKNIRKVEKFPYVITSATWRALAENKETKRKMEEEAKENRKKLRLEKKNAVNNKTVGKGNKKKIGAPSVPNVKNDKSETLTTVSNVNPKNCKKNVNVLQNIVLQEAGSSKVPESQIESSTTVQQMSPEETQCQNDKLTTIKETSPEQSKSQNENFTFVTKKFLVKGICYGCGNNITPNKMGRKCSRCPRSFHSSCEKKETYFAKTFRCSKCS